jgi:peptide deformylase
MILPVYLYGHPVLRKVTRDIAPDYPDLQLLLDNMFETLYQASGVGLAAPQIGLEDRILVVDLNPLADVDASFRDFRRVFINAHIVEKAGTEETIEEGCLSIPGIHEKVPRANGIRIRYLDETLQPHDKIFEGYKARVIQHEYDHLEGVMFIDRIPGIRKSLIRSKLDRIMKGDVKCSYQVKPAPRK